MVPREGLLLRKTTLLEIVFFPAAKLNQKLTSLTLRTHVQVKPHLFTHTKHRIAQLETLLSQREA